MYIFSWKIFMTKNVTKMIKASVAALKYTVVENVSQQPVVQFN